MFSYNCFSFRSYLKIFDAFWINFSTGQKTGIQFQSTTREYPVFRTPCIAVAVFSPLPYFIPTTRLFSVSQNHSAKNVLAVWPFECPGLNVSIHSFI
jgi:hypothetical protein